MFQQRLPLLNLKMEVVGLTTGWLSFLVLLQSCGLTLVMIQPFILPKKQGMLQKTAPLAIMSAVFGTSFMGFALAIVTSFSITEVSATAGTVLEVPFAQCLYNHLGKREMLALWSLIIFVQINTAASQCIDSSSVVFAFSRDGALPGSRYWSRVNSYTQTSVWAVAFTVTGAALLGLLTLQLEKRLALFSCAVIALYISYAIPIFMRLISKDFQKGAWHLGAFSKPIALIACLWVAFITISESKITFPWHQGLQQVGREGLRKDIH